MALGRHAYNGTTNGKGQRLHSKLHTSLTVERMEELLGRKTPITEPPRPEFRRVPKQT